MDPAEITGYAIEIAKWTSIMGGGIGTYVAGLSATQALAQCFSEKIKDQEHLDRVVREEATKLDISQAIRGRLTDMQDVSLKTFLGGHYEIWVGRGFWATRSSVRHELYHLKKSHRRLSNPILNGLNYIFRQEPQATIYQTTGIKL